MAGFFYIFTYKRTRKNMPFYVIVIMISFIASLAGLALIKANRMPVLFLFSFFLLLSMFVEYTCSTMSSNNKSNLHLYNLFIPVEFSFYLLFFMFVFKSKKIKKIILIVILLYLAFAVSNILWIQGPDTYQSYSFILGCLLVVSYSIIYLYLLFRVPETGSLVKNCFFWIASGLMFYYTCTLPLYGLENSIIAKMPSYNRGLYLIGDFLNILLYTLFSIGFLCQINLRKLLQLS